MDSIHSMLRMQARLDAQHLIGHGVPLHRAIAETVERLQELFDVDGHDATITVEVEQVYAERESQIEGSNCAD